jgi:hypothetical protein
MDQELNILTLVKDDEGMCLIKKSRQSRKLKLKQWTSIVAGPLMVMSVR